MNVRQFEIGSGLVDEHTSIIVSKKRDKGKNPGIFGASAPLQLYTSGTSAPLVQSPP